MDCLGATNGAVDIVPGLTRSVGRVRIEALFVLVPAMQALKGAEEWVLKREDNEEIRNWTSNDQVRVIISYDVPDDYPSVLQSNQSLQQRQEAPCLHH